MQSAVTAGLGYLYVYAITSNKLLGTYKDVSSAKIQKHFQFCKQFDFFEAICSKYSHNVLSYCFSSSYLLCREQYRREDAQPLCTYLAVPEAIRQLMFYDIVTQLHTPHFVLQQNP